MRKLKELTNPDSPVHIYDVDEQLSVQPGIVSRFLHLIGIGPFEARNNYTQQAYRVSRGQTGEYQFETEWKPGEPTKTEEWPTEQEFKMGQLNPRPDKPNHYLWYDEITSAELQEGRYTARDFDGVEDDGILEIDSDGYALGYWRDIDINPNEAILPEDYS